MKGIYISVPDNEFNFYLSVLERFKTATLIKTDEFKIDEHKLLDWQIEELNIALKEDENDPNGGDDAKTITSRLKAKFNV